MRLLLTAAVAASLFAPVAFAQDTGASHDRYVSISGAYVGKSDYSYELPTSPASTFVADVAAGRGVNVAFGKKLQGNWRGEVALSHREQDIKSQFVWNGGSYPDDGGSLSALSLDFNGYYDFPVKGRLRPYVGAGVGLAQIELKDGEIDDSTSTLNLQLMAGADLRVTDRVSIFAEGRYQRLGSLEVEISGTHYDSTHKFAIDGVVATTGLKFAF